MDPISSKVFKIHRVVLKIDDEARTRACSFLDLLPCPTFVESSIDFLKMALQVVRALPVSRETTHLRHNADAALELLDEITEREGDCSPSSSWREAGHGASTSNGLNETGSASPAPGRPVPPSSHLHASPRRPLGVVELGSRKLWDRFGNKATWTLASTPMPKTNASYRQISVAAGS